MPADALGSPARRRGGRLLVVLAVVGAVVAGAVIGGALTSGGGTSDAAAAGTFEPLVAHLAGSGAQVYPAPRQAGTPTAEPARNSLGVPTVFLVRRQQPGWVEVYLPVRPNGSTGWIPAAQLTLVPDPYAVLVSRSGHQLTVTDGSRQVLQASAGVGTAADPTPLGTFFVTELLRQPDPSGPYGPWAYGLSGFSDTLQHFGGGPGQIGLHGTDQPSSVGADQSHGCIRVDTSTIDRLVQFLPLGTPVVVSG